MRQSKVAWISAAVIIAVVAAATVFVSVRYFGVSVGQKYHDGHGSDTQKNQQHEHDHH